MGSLEQFDKQFDSTEAENALENMIADSPLYDERLLFHNEDEKKAYLREFIKLHPDYIKSMLVGRRTQAMGNQEIIDASPPAL